MASFRAQLIAAGENAATRLAVALEAALGDAVPISWSDLGDGRWAVDAYWEGESAAIEGAIRGVAKRHRAARAVEIGPLPDIDWVAASLAGLGPIRVGRFVVHGAHDRTKPLANDIAIEIEAGQAFGTGHHGTTAGCLKAIADLAKRRRIRSALDLGTGSGVLAIAIARLCRVPVIATDVDGLAARIAADNARLNRVGHRVQALEATGLRHRVLCDRRFDLIVANILAGPLAALAPAIARHLEPAGVVILSGLLPGQRAGVLAPYRMMGLLLRRALIRDGWLTLVLARGSV